MHRGAAFAPATCERRGEAEHAALIRLNMGKAVTALETPQAIPLETLRNPSKRSGRCHFLD